MIRTRMTLIALATLFSLAAIGSSARAGTYAHVDRLALSMERQVKALNVDFHDHFRHMASYGHLRADTLRLLRIARHVHLVAHQNGSVVHLRHDIEEADRRFHHLEEVLESVVHHDPGHFHGNVRHALVLMRQLKSTLHHLREDVENLVRARSRHHVPGHGWGGYPRSGGHYGHTGRPAVGYRWRGGSISYNGHGWQLRLGR